MPPLSQVWQAEGGCQTLWGHGQPSHGPTRSSPPDPTPEGGAIQPPPLNVTIGQALVSRWGLLNHGAAGVTLVGMEALMESSNAMRHQVSYGVIKADLS